MSSVSVAPPIGAAPGRRRPAWWPVWRTVRWLIAAVLVAAGVLLMLSEQTFRVWETHLAALVIDAVFAHHAAATTVSGVPGVVYNVGAHWWVLRVTIECSIALYLGPLIVVGGVLAAVPRMQLWRALAATAMAAVAMVLLNQVRILMLGWVFASFGRGAFEWAHSLGGSFLMLFGLAGCLFLFFQVVVVGSRRALSGRGRRALGN